MGKNFKKVMLLWQGSIVEIDYGLFRVFGQYFIGKSLSTLKILIFGLWSFIYQAPLTQTGKLHPQWGAT